MLNSVHLSTDEFHLLLSDGRVLTNLRQEIVCPLEDKRNTMAYLAPQNTMTSSTVTTDNIDAISLGYGREGCGTERGEIH